MGPITIAGRTPRAPTCSARCPRTSAQAYEAHLATCPACRAEADELRVAAQALPLSAAARCCRRRR